MRAPCMNRRKGEIMDEKQRRKEKTREMIERGDITFEAKLCRTKKDLEEFDRDLERLERSKKSKK